MFRPSILTTAIAVLLPQLTHAADVTLRGSDPANTSSFTTALPAPNGWNNDADPSAGNNYFTGAFQLRTPTGTGSATFAGDSLSIDSGGNILFKGSGIYTINNLILNGGALIQGDTGVAAPNNIATIAGNVTVNAASVIDTTTNTNRIITIASAIHGSGGLAIQGTGGAVNFTNTANDFTGSITLNGTSPLVITSISNGGIASPLGAASSDAGNLIFNGGILRFNGASAASTDRLLTLNVAGGTIESTQNAAPITFTNTGSIGLGGTGNRTLTLGGTSTGANTFTPSIGDSGGTTSVTKAGAGTWNLTGNSSYSGATTITGGVLVFAQPSSLGTGSNVNIGAGNLRWGVGNTADISLSKVITLTGGNAGLDTNGQVITLAGVLTGAGNLVKQGNGTLTLSAQNTFTGNVSVGNNAGTLRITDSQALGFGAKTITVTGNVGGANTPSFVLAGGSNGIVLPGTMTFITSNDGLNGNPISPAMVNESGNNTINGNFTLTSGGGGTRFLVNADRLTLNGTLTPFTNLARTAYFAGAGDGVANNLIRNGTAAAEVMTVVKDGAGTWVLNGANTYTGSTTINAGTLWMNTASSGNGAVTVASGARLGVNVAASGQSLAVPSLTTNSGVNTLAFNLNGFGVPSAAPLAPTTFNANGTTTIAVSGANLAANVPIPLIDYTSISGTGFAGLTVSLPLRSTGSLVDNLTDGRVDLLLTSYDFPRWTGAADNKWDTATQNWAEVNGTLPTAYIQGGSGSDSVLFDNFNDSPSTVDLTTTLTPSSVTVNNTAKVYTFSGTGKLSGTMSLLKQGTGTLILANTGGNDFTGAVTIASGTLQLGDGATAGAGIPGIGAIINNGTLSINRPDDFQLSNAISGSGAVVKNGGGSVTLLGNNSYSGAVTINSGILLAGNVNALGTISAGTTVNAGGTLDVNGTLLPVGETITIIGAGVSGQGAVINRFAGGQNTGIKSLVLAGNATIGGTQRWDFRDVAGGLNGGGFALTKTGTNDIWLKDLADTMVGNFVIQQGLLGFEGTTTFGSPTGSLIVGITGALGLFNNVASNTKAMDIQGGRISAQGGAANVLSGDMTLSAPSTLESTSGVTLTVNSTISGPGGFTKTGPGIVEVGGATSNAFTGDVTVSAGTLRLNKAGVAIPGNAIAGGGTLSVIAANQFSSTSNITINTGGTWSNASNLQQTVNNFTVNTGTLQSLNNLNVLGTFSMTAGLHDMNSGQSTTANAVSISNNANLRLGANSGDTTLHIGVGGLNLSSGTLQLGQTGGAVAAVVNLAGNMTGSGTSRIFNPNNTGARILDLQSGIRAFNILDGTTTVTPTIQNGGIAKTGPGTLVLSGNSTYTDSTIVNAGTLVVNGSISGSIATVNNGATLAGVGPLGAVNVGPGGILSPAQGLGVMSAGEVDLGDGAIFSIDLSAVSSDTLTLGGSLSLAGTVALDITLTSTATDGTIFTIVNTQNPILGLDTGGRFAYAGNILEEGENFAVTSGPLSQFYTISYAADGGNDVVLTAVPEPGSAVFLLGGLGLVAMRRRNLRG